METKDILSIERVQRKATKFILNDYTSEYGTRLLSLHLLPLMHWFELQDIMFLVKCLQNPSDNMNINTYITFVSSITRAGSNGSKLRYNHNLRTSAGRHFYFIRVVRLWNSLPSIDTTKSFASIKCLVRDYLWTHFEECFDPTNICTFHLVCPCSKCYLSWDALHSCCFAFVNFIIYSRPTML